MNLIQDSPEDVAREVQELAELLRVQAEKVNEIARMLVERIEQRINKNNEVM